MSQKSAKAFRQKLGMTNKVIKAIRKQDDYQRVKPITKVVYFRNSLGILVPQRVTRSQIINRHKFYYRLQKKQLKGVNNGQ